MRKMFLIPFSGINMALIDRTMEELQSSGSLQKCENIKMKNKVDVFLFHANQR